MRKLNESKVGLLRKTRGEGGRVYLRGPAKKTAAALARCGLGKYDPGVWPERRPSFEISKAGLETLSAIEALEAT